MQKDFDAWNNIKKKLENNQRTFFFKEGENISINNQKRYILLYQIRMFSINRFQRRLASLDSADFKRIKEKLKALLEL